MHIEIEYYDETLNCSLDCHFLSGNESFCHLFKQVLGIKYGESLRCEQCINREEIVISYKKENY